MLPLFTMTEMRSRIKTKARETSAENFTPPAPRILDITHPEIIAETTREIRANKGMFSVEFSDEFATKAKTKDTPITDTMHTHKDSAKPIKILFSVCLNFIIKKTSEQVFYN